jgi:predicted NAD/FAD-binding protein
MGRRHVAVIGGGVAGLTAGYLLQRVADVTLYEADGRLGGHAHTHELLDPDGRSLNVDSGFIVHNRQTYPNLTRLFDELGVETQESEMSMSIRCDGCGLQYAGARRLSGLFPTLRNATNVRYLYLLTEVVRFHRRARRHLAATATDGMTLDEFLAQGRFSRYFRSHFVVPMVACVWSCAPAEAGAYPARYLFEFLANHGMLSVRGSHPWRTVTGGSASYVEKVGKQLSAVNLLTPVKSVSRTARGVRIVDADDQAADFDAVVIATHPDQALAMLSEPTGAEAATLGAWTYSKNRAALHTDASILPPAERARAAWNYQMPACHAAGAEVHVTYDMTRLQRLPSQSRYLVTLNGEESVDRGQLIAQMVYEHPMFTPDSVATRATLPTLNDGVIAFAGAYHGWGFHEDGCRAGVAAAASLGADW